MLRTATKKLQQGFTLIELLIVIAVLGVLAAGVLIAINPAEQLARARDASRKTAVGQLNKAAQAYYTSQSSYPTANVTWITTLINAGEIKSIPSTPAVPLCGSANFAQGGYCYNTASVGTPASLEAIVYVELESKSEAANCPAASPTAYFLWSSADSKAGIVCTANSTTDPAPGTTYKFTYYKGGAAE